MPVVVCETDTEHMLLHAPVQKREITKKSKSLNCGVSKYHCGVCPAKIFSSTVCALTGESRLKLVEQQLLLESTVSLLTIPVCF